jgi:sulfur carrier protein ThiS
MRVHLGGHLSWYDRERRDWLTVAQAAPISLPDLAAALGVPAEEVAIIAVNRRIARWDDPPVNDSDLVEFFPPMGGG